MGLYNYVVLSIGWFDVLFAGSWSGWAVILIFKVNQVSDVFI